MEENLTRGKMSDRRGGNLDEGEKERKKRRGKMKKKRGQKSGNSDAAMINK